MWLFLVNILGQGVESFMQDDPHKMLQLFIIFNIKIDFNTLWPICYQKTLAKLSSTLNSN